MFSCMCSDMTPPTVPHCKIILKSDRSQTYGRHSVGTFQLKRVLGFAGLRDRGLKSVGPRKALPPVARQESDDALEDRVHGDVDIP